MVNYRRNRITGGTYFFTVNLQNRQSALLVEHIDLLRKATKVVRRKQPFHIDAVVVLPDHLHTIWTLPSGDDDYPGRWQAIKTTFTKELRKLGIRIDRNDKGEYNVWQRRYWEHTIRDSSDSKRHVDYIHYNPVKHGYVDHVSQWPYSSFHWFVRRGRLPSDWAGVSVTNAKGFGE